jgi:hypothetical protein
MSIMAKIETVYLLCSYSILAKTICVLSTEVEAVYLRIVSHMMDASLATRSLKLLCNLG